MKNALVLVALLVVVLAGGVVAADIALESKQVKRHTFSGPIDEIVVRSDGGDLAFVAGRGRGVQVRETQHYVLRRPTLQRSVADGVLTLEIGCRVSFVTCFGDLRVSVPAGATIRVDADSGDVAARGVDVAAARVRSDSGDIHLELAGRQHLVRAQTDSGDVDVVARDVGRVDARSDSGDIVVTTRGARDVTTQTDSGDVVVAASRRPRRVRADTDSGDVRVVVPAGAYRLATETDSGEVKLKRISRNDRADRSIEAHTDSGDVTLDGG
jgi:hypothetical protein